MVHRLRYYLANLGGNRQLLWCYLLWYMSMTSFHFEPIPSLWLNALGIGLLFGLALFASTGPVTLIRVRQRFWETLRLFACPFLVSSFSAMVRDKDFFLLFSSSVSENISAAAVCTLFLLTTFLIRTAERNRSAETSLHHD